MGIRYSTVKRDLKKGGLWAGFLALLAASLACSFLTSRMSSFQKVTSSTSGLIAYVGTDENIYSIDQMGKAKSAITKDAGGQAQSYQFPAWSPDSQRLSFVGVQNSGGSQSAIVYTSAPDGKDRVEVFRSSDEVPFYFYWSPDSQFLSFLASSASDQGLNLHLVPARGGEAKVLGMGSPFYWDWSPDSHRIVVHTGGDAISNPDARMSFLTLGAQDEKKLDLRPGQFQAPAWSPDGSQLLLSTVADNEQAALLLLKADGSGQKTLETSNGPQAFGWSPDATKVAYLAPKGPDIQPLFRAMKLFDLGAQQSKVIVPDDEVMAFFWSPDSRRIAYLIPSLEPQPTGPQGVSQTQPSLILSLVIYDVTTGLSHPAAQFNPADDLLNIIPFFDQYQRSATIWSPDSLHLVVSAKDQANKLGIYVVDATGSQSMTYIADGSLAFWSWK